MFANVIFKRDGEVVKGPRYMSLDEMPRLGETLTLPGSGRKHEVSAVYKKVGARREGGHFLKKVEIELRKPETK